MLILRTLLAVQRVESSQSGSTNTHRRDSFQFVSIVFCRAEPSSTTIKITSQDDRHNYQGHICVVSHDSVATGQTINLFVWGTEGTAVTICQYSLHGSIMLVFNIHKCTTAVLKSHILRTSAWKCYTTTRLAQASPPMFYILLVSTMMQG